MTRVIVLHGVESTGKSVLAARLAAHFGVAWVPEYGRTHAETHGVEMDAGDLSLIARTQSAMIAAARDAARRAGHRFVIADTDSLMTAAWARMMLGDVPPDLMTGPHADLYLLLRDDVPWVADPVRIYGDVAARTHFAGIAQAVLEEAGVRWSAIGGDWDARFTAAVARIEQLERAQPMQAFDLNQENE